MHMARCLEAITPSGVYNCRLQWWLLGENHQRKRLAEILISSGIVNHEDDNRKALKHLQLVPPSFGRPMCRWAFCGLLGITAKKLNSSLTTAREQLGLPAIVITHGNVGGLGNANSATSPSGIAEAWMREYFNEMTCLLPGEICDRPHV